MLQLAHAGVWLSPLLSSSIVVRGEKRHRKKRLRPSNDHRLLASSFHDDCPLRHCRSFKVIPEAILRGEKKYNIIYTYISLRLNLLLLLLLSSTTQKKQTPTTTKTKRERNKARKIHNQMENFWRSRRSTHCWYFLHTMCSLLTHPTLDARGSCGPLGLNTRGG